MFTTKSIVVALSGFAAVYAVAVENRQVDSIIGDITGGADSIFDKATEIAGGLPSRITDAAGDAYTAVTGGADNVYQGAKSVGGKAVTVVTSEGGEAITLVEGAGGKVTEFAGRQYTIATNAAGDAANTGNAAHSTYSFGVSTSLLASFAAVAASGLLGAWITL